MGESSTKALISISFCSAGVTRPESADSIITCPVNLCCSKHRSDCGTLVIAIAPASLRFVILLVPAERLQNNLDEKELPSKRVSHKKKKTKRSSSENWIVLIFKGLLIKHFFRPFFFDCSV